MTDKPIIFSTPMIRAVLAGNKTQTRRALKPQPNMLNGGLPLSNGRGSYSTASGWQRYRFATGDRLWVKETWQVGDVYNDISPSQLRDDHLIDYAADGLVKSGGRTRVSIHLPRRFSRLTLHVTNVRVQRLHDITDADAIDEGIWRFPSNGGPLIGYGYDPKGTPGSAVRDSPREAYGALFDHINGAGSWDADPWVCAVTFSVERANIDYARET